MNKISNLYLIFIQTELDYMFLNDECEATPSSRLV